ncbi:BTB/POZ domain-containing protein 6-B-like [Porites lutea]|uniref:BTB/POZ domain-containing protein 6-B-like n=1 Tax=Porites lutea TaxID=51062 RepID=UPI003CC6D847
MAVQTNWQITRSTVRERTKFMFNNEHLSDVKFVVRGNDGESERNRSITAHKFVLSIGSPVFEAMFYGELAETKDTIQLPDCDYESLLELFRYLYSDEVNLSGSSVLGVLYLAKKYMVPSLTEKCKDYLQDKLDPSNVFTILPTALKYEEKNLVDRCWKVIESQTEQALKSDGFEMIEKTLLEALVQRETLEIREVELFKGCDRWAIKQCRKQGLATDGELKRRVLGEEIIKAIRYGVMKQEEFAGVVLDAKILTPDEIVTFFKFFSSQEISLPLGFSETRRRSWLHRCGRFTLMQRSSWDCNGLSRDVIEFKALYQGSPYSVFESPVRLVKLERSTYPSKLLESCQNFSYHGLEVLFNSNPSLKQNTLYHISVLISGAKSGKGCKGLKSVKIAGVTFTFLTPPTPTRYALGDRNSVEQGQFAEFLFSLPN